MEDVTSKSFFEEIILIRVEQIPTLENENPRFSRHLFAHIYDTRLQSFQ
jgi:hypothetical protein